VTTDLPGCGVPAMSMGMGSRVMVAPPAAAPLPGCGSYMQPHQQQQMMPAMQCATSACLPNSSTAAAGCCCRPIRHQARQGQPCWPAAPAVSAQCLLAGGCTGRPHAAACCCCSACCSCAGWHGAGCVSPALINAPRSAFGSASSSAGEWWLSAAGPFAEAGMGALVMGSAGGSDGGVLGDDAGDEAELLLPGNSSGLDCCDMVMSMMAAESLSGAALMLH
ncbi:hypothetical protein COO60DRAFT_1472902, partial [Scenedesmus sp. NREL 46B-D3]